MRLAWRRAALFASLGLAGLAACNALVGNREATPAEPDGCDGCGADATGPVQETGATDAAVAYDGPSPVVKVEIFGERPAAYGEVGADGSTHDAVFDWLPYQKRATDLEVQSKTVIVALDGFNRIVATSPNCIVPGCPAPTVTVAGGAFHAEQSTIDGGVFAYRIVGDDPELLHVPSPSDVCLVFQHPGWPSPRGVLVRVWRGDFDGDGRIEDGGTDMDVFAQNFGATPPAEAHTDLNSDGTCNTGKTRVLAKPCP
jgi:hypothetical protein